MILSVFSLFLFIIHIKKGISCLDANKSIKRKIISAADVLNTIKTQVLQCVTIEFRQGPIYIVNSNFLRPSSMYESGISTKPSWLIFRTTDSFPMRYCITLHLKGYQKYDRSKLKNKVLLSKFRLFKFD